MSSLLQSVCVNVSGTLVRFRYSRFYKGSWRGKMTVGVSYTFGGDVAVVDMDTGKRWDMSPGMANDAAEKFEAAAGYMTASALVVCQCYDDREFCWAGDRADALKMAADLRSNSALASAARSPA